MANQRETVQSGAIRPTVFIGLGGTGKEVLLRLRRRFYERLREKSLPCTRFLWIDTDTRDVDARGEKLDEMYQRVRFDEAEKVGLLQGKVGADLARVFKNREQFSYIHSWLHPAVERYGLEIQDGAGGVRVIGRLCFFERYRRPGGITDKVERSIQAVLSQNVINETEELFHRFKLGTPQFSRGTASVVVVASIAGGTGGGMLLDMLFYLRYLQQKKLVHLIESITAFVVLPNVYYENTSEERGLRSWANGYAALQEIEHFTLRRLPGLPGLGIDFEVEWERGVAEKIVGPPAQVMYLIERFNEAPASIQLSERSELFWILADGLYMDFLPTPFATTKRADYANVSAALASAQPVHVTSRAIKLPQEFARRYASFGFSKIEIPRHAIQAACAADLAADMLAYINREPQDTAIKETVLDDLAQRRLDANGIAGRFGTGWREKIDRRTGELIRSKALDQVQQIDELESALAELDRELLRSDKAAPAQWGTIINELRGQTELIVKEVKEEIRRWVNHCLEERVRGLKAASKPGGYLEIGRDLLRQLHEPIEASRPATYDWRIEQAEEDARTYRERYQKTLGQLRECARSVLLTLLANKASARESLREQLLDSVQQAFLAKAEACLLAEAKKVAGQAHAEVERFRSRLTAFRLVIEPLERDYRSESQALREPRKPVLTVPIFEREWYGEHYYRLDHEPVIEDKAGRELAGLLRQVEDLEDKSQVGLVEWTEKSGVAELSRHLRRYTEERFLDDFRSNPRQVNFLDGIRNRQGGLERAAQDLVRYALPLARTTDEVSGQQIQTAHASYLGVYDKDLPGWDPFIRHVREALSNTPYSDLEVLTTGEPSEIYLYTVKYAFPLPTLVTVTSECDPAYAEFYRNLGRHLKQNAQNAIGLHLSQTWEGLFDDLVGYDDTRAAMVREATEILLLGSIIGVLLTEWDPNEKRIQYSYRQTRPFERVVPMGAKWQARKFLVEEKQARSELLEAVGVRKRQFSNEQLKLYWSILVYLRLKGAERLSLAESGIVDDEIAACSREAQIRKLPDPTAGFGDLSDAERAEKVRDKLGDAVEFRGDERTGEFVIVMRPAATAAEAALHSN